MRLALNFLSIIAAATVLSSTPVSAETSSSHVVYPPVPIMSPLLSAEEIVDTIALCIRAVQPGNNLPLGEFKAAGWKARAPRAATDQLGGRYTGYTFRKADALSSIRVYETRPVCSVHVETIHEAKKAEIENLVLSKLGGIPSEQQDGYEEFKAKFMTEDGENGGWGEGVKQLSEQMFFFENAALTLEIVEIGNTRMMVTNIMAIENNS